MFVVLRYCVDCAARPLLLIYSFELQIVRAWLLVSHTVAKISMD